MKHRPGLCAALAAIALTSVAHAQVAAKKELVQRVLKIQEAEIESVARSMVERPAAQMMQQADMAIRGQVPPEKRESTAKAVEAEVKKYFDETYPLVRDRAIRIAPGTAGAILEKKMSQDELKQLVAWLESPLNRKYQRLAPDMRNAFIQKLLVEGRPLVEPNVQALDGKIRVILGVAPATPQSTAAPPTVPAVPAARASGK